MPSKNLVPNVSLKEKLELQVSKTKGSTPSPKRSLFAPDHSVYTATERPRIWYLSWPPLRIWTPLRWREAKAVPELSRVLRQELASHLDFSKTSVISPNNGTHLDCSSLSILAAVPWVETSETSAVASRLSHYQTLAQHDLNIRQPATTKQRHARLLPAVNHKLLEGRVRVFCAFPTFFTLTIKMDPRKQLCTLTPGSDKRQLFSCP